MTSGNLEKFFFEILKTKWSMEIWNFEICKKILNLEKNENVDKILKFVKQYLKLRKKMEILKTLWNSRIWKNLEILR